MERELRLTEELVPSSTWYLNLRSAVPRETWDTIRRAAYREHGYRCAVCGARGRLSCHTVAPARIRSRRRAANQGALTHDLPGPLRSGPQLPPQPQVSPIA